MTVTGIRKKKKACLQALACILPYHLLCHNADIKLVVVIQQTQAAVTCPPQEMGPTAWLLGSSLAWHLHHQLCISHLLCLLSPLPVPCKTPSETRPFFSQESRKFTFGMIGKWILKYTTQTSVVWVRAPWWGGLPTYVTDVSLSPAVNQYLEEDQGNTLDQRWFLRTTADSLHDNVGGENLTCYGY